MECSSMPPRGWMGPKASRAGMRLNSTQESARELNAIVSSGIPPGEQFDYVVPINESGQWGTYWVHAHASVRITYFW